MPSSDGHNKHVALLIQPLIVKNLSFILSMAGLPFIAPSILIGVSSGTVSPLASFIPSRVIVTPEHLPTGMVVGLVVTLQLSVYTIGIG